MPMCIMNQNTGSVAIACNVVPNITNATMATTRFSPNSE